MNQSLLLQSQVLSTPFFEPIESPSSQMERREIFLKAEFTQLQSEPWQCQPTPGTVLDARIHRRLLDQRYRFKAQLIPSIAWNGLLFIRSGFYEEAVFKFNIVFPKRYPNELPQVCFFNKIYHSLVDLKTGNLDFSQIFSNHLEKENSTNRHTAYDGFCVDLVQFIWRIFHDLKVFTIDSSFNKRAAQMFMFNQLEFSKKAKESVNLSRKNIESNPKHSCLQLQLPRSANDIENSLYISEEIKRRLSHNQSQLQGECFEELKDRIVGEFIEELFNCEY